MRGALVTGVQTCALPIWESRHDRFRRTGFRCQAGRHMGRGEQRRLSDLMAPGLYPAHADPGAAAARPRPAAAAPRADGCHAGSRLAIARLELARRRRHRRMAMLAVRRGRSEEHTSELQSLMRISYAVFCLKKQKRTHEVNT